MNRPSNADLRNDLLGSEASASTEENVNKTESGRRSQLLSARREMETELQRLRSTTAVIEESSKTIGSVNEKYTTYGSSLSRASKTLKALKTKMENDDKYIYYSFVFFLCVSGYVFLKRVKLIAITSWFAAKIYGVTNWATGLITPDVPITTQHPSKAETTLAPHEHPMMAPTNSTRRKSPTKLDEEL